MQDCALLIFTIQDEFICRKCLEVAKQLKPNIQAVFVSPNREEGNHIVYDHLGKVFIPREVVADAIAHYAMERFGRQEEEERFKSEREQERKAVERGAK